MLNTRCDFKKSLHKVDCHYSSFMVEILLLFVPTQNQSWELDSEYIIFCSAFFKYFQDLNWVYCCFMDI